MRLVLLTVAAVVLLLALAGTVVFGFTTNTRAALKPGKMAPDFTVKSTDGRTVALAALKDKVVLLNFFDYT